jgi:hypothetical protein
MEAVCGSGFLVEHVDPFNGGEICGYILGVPIHPGDID